MVTGSEAPAPAPSRARRDFHLALGGVLIPIAAPVVTLILAAWNTTRGLSDPEQRRWTLRLWALGAVDVAMAIVVLAFLRPEAQALSGPVAAVGAPKVRIGVSFAPDDTRAVVAAVLPGSPAERAGIRPGDLIRAIDGTACSTREDVQRLIGSGEPGVRVTLTIERGAETLGVPVVPASTKHPLFEAVPSRGDSASPVTDVLKGAAPAVVVALILLLRARRTPGGPPIWRWALLALAGPQLIGLGAALVLNRIQGGASPGSLLVALLIQVSALFLLSFPFVRSQERGVESRPRISSLRGFFQGLFYMLTGLPRMGSILLAGNAWLFDGEGGGAGSALRTFAQVELGLAGMALFVSAVVVVGPIAEEVFFRGFLLPRLYLKTSLEWARVGSAVFFGLLHWQYGIFVPIVVLYGWVFAWARLRTGSLAAPIALHMLVNGAATLVFLLR